MAHRCEFCGSCEGSVIATSLPTIVCTGEALAHLLLKLEEMQSSCVELRHASAFSDVLGAPVEVLGTDIPAVLRILRCVKDAHLLHVSCAHKLETVMLASRTLALAEYVLLGAAVWFTFPL
jgi:hypothetical protein